MKDGIYKNDTAYYFIKGGNIMMKLNGLYYKTNENFMIGATYQGPLNEGMVAAFDKAYETCKNW